MISWLPIALFNLVFHYITRSGALWAGRKRHASKVICQLYQATDQETQMSIMCLILSSWYYRIDSWHVCIPAALSSQGIIKITSQAVRIRYTTSAVNLSPGQYQSQSQQMSARLWRPAHDASRCVGQWKYQNPKGCFSQSNLHSKIRAEIKINITEESNHTHVIQVIKIGQN